MMSSTRYVLILQLAPGKDAVVAKLFFVSSLVIPLPGRVERRRAGWYAAAPAAGGGVRGSGRCTAATAGIDISTDLALVLLGNCISVLLTLLPAFLLKIVEFNGD